MDKDTRNAIERATQRARKLLEEDFAAQLEGDFDINLDGAMAAKAGPHLSARQALARERIIAAIEHKRAVGTTAKDAVRDYLRDAAFTTLNRFVALKMLEARDLVQECIAKGEQSSGYREFYGMAPGIPLLPDSAGYRLYIECLFDELSTEVKVLFDRRDTSSVLWPKRATFAELLEILNASELASIWAEDETIGWVYQFFNSSEERRKMREESQAPRNSRELAVRNQFFTPRYVVQFLSDNTLGRIWYEMRGGDTRLKDQCDYMVRRSDEAWEPRDQKDPRDVRVLDPACGSGHFLLYCFDLLLVMYEEAWGDGTSPASEATGKPLREDYPEISDLRAVLPGLILRHNLHGVDIDPRCAQIAQLALWMRAQRAFRDFGIGRAERPIIKRANIVIAEPMPGEKDLLKEFLAELKEDKLKALISRALNMPPDKRLQATKAMAESLAELVETVWDGLKPAGEMGTLLKTERDLSQAIEMGRAEWEDTLPLFRVADYGLTGITTDKVAHLVPGRQTDFWTKAEQLVFLALADYAASASATTSARRRLFAEDAVQGFALMDLMAKKFDVVLMNPPFGYAPDSLRDYISDRIADIDALFVTRGVEFLEHRGRLGVITNRTQLMKPTLEHFRATNLQGMARLQVCVDLGSGVLDALVETAAYISEKGAPSERTAIFGNGLGSRNKHDVVRRTASMEDVREFDLEVFRELPENRFAHWLQEDLINLLRTQPKLNDAHSVAFGLSTTDNFRFIRLRWEVPSQSIVAYHQKCTGWVPLAKGGQYSPYVGDIHLVINWKSNGAALRAMSGAPIRNENLYGRSGLTFTKRTASAFAPRILPAGCIIEVNGPTIQLPGGSCGDSNDTFTLLGVLSSRVSSYLTDALVAAGDTSVAGSAAKDYIPGVIGELPVPAEVAETIGVIVSSLCSRAALVQAFDETSAHFVGPLSLLCAAEVNDISERFALATDWSVADIVERARLAASYLKLVEDAYSLSTAAKHELDVTVGPIPGDQNAHVTRVDTPLKELSTLSNESIVAAALNTGITRKDISKNAYHSDRRLELMASLSGIGLDDIAEYLHPHVADIKQWYAQEWSFALGVAFGRWQLPLTGLTNASSEPSALMEPLPQLPPCGTKEFSQLRAILVDDPGSREDVLTAIEATFQSTQEGPAVVNEWLARSSDFRDWLRTNFFNYHLSQYSKSRRKAPVYWQLATRSASYSVWLYIHAFSKDTMFRVQNEYVALKLSHEERRLEAIRRDLGEGASAARRREFAAQENFVVELRAFLDEVKRVVPLWHPNLDDGVIINFAPLWRLVPHHKPWQKELKSTWDSLCAGKYDWAHLAMHLWPERVVQKCAEDRSLAIAHDLEDVFWYQDDNEKWKPRKQPTESVEDLVKARISSAVQAALKSLLEAPVPAGTRGQGRKRRRQSATAV